MRDAEIRQALLATLGAKFAGSLIRSELGLCLGACRVDVAVVNGHLHGYEIKSARDSLARLDTQIGYYSRVLDYAAVVASEKHVEPLRERLPEWWSLYAATPSRGAVEFRRVQRGRRNRRIDKLALAQLLWREEAAALLERQGHHVTARDTRWDLWHRLTALPLRELQAAVRESLKVRPHWPGG